MVDESARRRACFTLTALLVGVLATPSVVLGDPCTAPFATDRPTATNGHGTVGAGCIQVETSFNVNRTPKDTTLSFALSFDSAWGKTSSSA